MPSLCTALSLQTENIALPILIHPLLSTSLPVSTECCKKMHIISFYTNDYLSTSRPLRSLNRLHLLVPRGITRGRLSLGPLPQMVPLFGMHFLLLYALIFYQAVLRLPLHFSKPISSQGTLHTGSASERLTPLEALHKCLNTIHVQYKRQTPSTIAF